MSRSTRGAQVRLAPQSEGETGFGAWVAGRATLLVAMGTLLALVAILIVISLVHPR